MRTILDLSAVIAWGGGAQAQVTFPLAFEGVWAETWPACAELKAGRVPSSQSSGAWLRIQGATVAGTLKGEIYHVTNRGSALIIDETWHVPEELIIQPDGVLQETIVGSGVSLRYRRCG